ncbi:MAG: hypothetical protein GY811_27090, partial [Myxococcales bacterium]|nr:hypothetical protein [Myxococcales bacterium]
MNRLATICEASVERTRKSRNRKRQRVSEGLLAAMMKNISCSLFAALLVVSACSDAKKDEASSSNALQSEAKVVSATETRDETPPSVAEKAPEPEAGPAYSDEIADQLIAQVDACESAIMGCDAADQLAAFGTKATGRLVAAVTAPDVEMERVVNLSFIIEKVKDPAAAQPLFESAKPQRGKPINPLLLTSMRLGDEAFYSMLLAKADAGSKRDMLAFQITSYAGSMCLTRNELADPLF